MHSTLETRVRRGVLAGAVAGALMGLTGCGVLDAASGTSSRQQYYEGLREQQRTGQQYTPAPVRPASQGEGWKLFTAKSYNALEALPEEVKDHFLNNEGFVIVINNRGSVNTQFKVEIFDAQGKKIESINLPSPGRNEGFTIKYDPSDIQPGSYTYSAYNERGFIGKGSFTIIDATQGKR